MSLSLDLIVLTDLRYLSGLVVITILKLLFLFWIFIKLLSVCTSNENGESISLASINSVSRYKAAAHTRVKLREKKEETILNEFETGLSVRSEGNAVKSLSIF